MSQTQAVLSAIQDSVRGTSDEMDVEAIIQAGRGKKYVGLIFEANGEERADRISDRLKARLESQLHGLLRIDRMLVQMSTSRAKPVLLGEWVTITGILADHCAQPGKWLGAPGREDDTLGSVMIVALVIWLVAVEHPN
ncbi:hypothetical protein [uncultured Fibrella sp.]|uniref:hypothetical protein n=1 Tax=uncultured Fibrella sp. TaxID=1284596 RepID=UPI0035CC3CCF